MAVGAQPASAARRAATRNDCNRDAFKVAGLERMISGAARLERYWRMDSSIPVRLAFASSFLYKVGAANFSDAPSDSSSRASGYCDKQSSAARIGSAMSAARGGYSEVMPPPLPAHRRLPLMHSIPNDAIAATVRHPSPGPIRRSHPVSTSVCELVRRLGSEADPFGPLDQCNGSGSATLRGAFGLVPDVVGDGRGRHGEARFADEGCSFD